MNDTKNSYTDSVNVTMHPVTLRDAGGSYARVARRTARMGNLTTGTYPARIVRFGTLAEVVTVM